MFEHLGQPLTRRAAIGMGSRFVAVTAFIGWAATPQTTHAAALSPEDRRWAAYRRLLVALSNSNLSVYYDDPDERLALFRGSFDGLDDERKKMFAAAYDALADGDERGEKAQPNAWYFERAATVSEAETGKPVYRPALNLLMSMNLNPVWDLNPADLDLRTVRRA